MTKQNALIVLKPDGYFTVFASEEVKITIVETWSPEDYVVDSFDEQVKQAAPHLHQTLYRSDFIRATGKPKPYQREIPLEEKHWWEILIAFLIALENRALARGLPNLGLLPRLNHIYDNPSEYGLWAELFAPELIEEVKQLRARHSLF